MEQNQERKFVCKYCNKRYPCGKSLGGHIRTHMNGNSAESEEEETKFKTSKILSSKRDSWIEAGGQSSYGLRENPKKTRRFVDSSKIALQQGMVCRECGKGFQSLKALCGHMACHSEKEKVTNNRFEENSGSSEKQKVVMDSQSDTETSAPSRRRRSNRTMRYKANDLYSNAISFANGSSSVSEIEHEQEEVAKCLMMLSKDSTFRKGFNSVAESSDNNSEVLEAKSSSIDVRITRKNGGDFVSNNADENLEMKKPGDNGKLKSAENRISSSDNSDSGYFRNGPKKVESHVSVDGFLRNVQSNKPKVEFGSGFEDFNAKLGKSLSKFKSMTEFGKDLVNDRADRASTKYDLRKSKRNDSCSPEFVCNNAQKRSKYECLTCNKTFHSHKALGGHRASHNKTNDFSESIYESGENSLGNDSFADPTVPDSKITEYCSGKNRTDQKLSGSSNKKLSSKKSKGHECPICFRVFRSGQALGGHKRSHFIGGHENSTVVIKEDLTKMPALIDLNLPAPIEEETMEHDGFMPW